MIASVWRVHNATNGHEFGKDYHSKSEAAHAASVYADRWPNNRYIVRAAPRCSSRCPRVGYGQCEQARNHEGACEWRGYRWFRGRGHARPVMISSPGWAQ